MLGRRRIPHIGKIEVLCSGVALSVRCLCDKLEPVSSREFLGKSVAVGHARQRVGGIGDIKTGNHGSFGIIGNINRKSLRITDREVASGKSTAGG